MGHDDMQRKTTRYHEHAHDPLARTWADDFNRLALGSQYEKTAAPFSKRRNSSYQPVDRSPGGFYGVKSVQPAGGSVIESVGKSIKAALLTIPGEAFVLFPLGLAIAWYATSKR